MVARMSIRAAHATITGVLRTHRCAGEPHRGVTPDHAPGDEHVTRPHRATKAPAPRPAGGVWPARATQRLALTEPDSAARPPGTRIPGTPHRKSASPREPEGDRHPWIQEVGLQRARTVAACHSSLTGPASQRRCGPVFPGQTVPDHLCFFAVLRSKKRATDTLAAGVDVRVGRRHKPPLRSL